jgi:hypothetical protein
MQRQRRRRDTLDHGRNLKLHVPESAKEPGFVYRWVNNRPGRVRDLTQADDYDIVSSEEIAGKSLGTTVERAANKFDGETMILVRKPKEFYDQDKAKDQKQLDAQEEAMRRRPPASPEGLNGPEAYIPGGKNIVNGR